MENKDVKVLEKEWANATPAGLAALAVACACFFALLSGNVDASAMPLIGCWLLGGAAVQIVVALVDLKGKNCAGGNTFLYFSAFFMLVSGLEMFYKYSAIVAGSPLDTRIDGYVWVMLTLVTYLWTPAFFKKFNLLSIVVVLLDVALPFIALTDLQIIPKEFSIISAWSLLASGLVAIYLSAGIVVNTTYGKKIYPFI